MAWERLRVHILVCVCCGNVGRLHFLL